jgi:beta-lysine N6-acetyltransferase
VIQGAGVSGAPNVASFGAWRGEELAAKEAAMRPAGLRVAYTIARAMSPGINFTFAGAGYRFGGTLVNNTQIGGRIESINVWYKELGV